VRPPVKLPVAPQRTAYWMTTAEAREKLGVTPGQLEKLIRHNKLVVLRIKGRRLVNTESVKAYYMERLRENANNL
jgi:excisionase family DNA binding protein